MNDGKAKILVLVEGEKTDVKLMKTIFSLYGINKSHQIVSYNTNIYALYNQMFKDNNPEDYDLLNVLKENEKDEKKRDILNDQYTDIILVFDLDPHDDNFSPKKIKFMQNYFKESTEMGKLYVNYPMIESFYHTKAIPDYDYLTYKINSDDITKYKSIVNKECVYRNYRKILDYGPNISDLERVKNKRNCSIIIYQNMIKAMQILEQSDTKNIKIDLNKLLQKQLSVLQNHGFLFVLCTSCFYILDYNPDLISNEDLSNVELSKFKSALIKSK